MEINCLSKIQKFSDNGFLPTQENHMKHISQDSKKTHEKYISSLRNRIHQHCVKNYKYWIGGIAFSALAGIACSKYSGNFNFLNKDLPLKIASEQCHLDLEKALKNLDDQRKSGADFLTLNELGDLMDNSKCDFVKRLEAAESIAPSNTYLLEKIFEERIAEGNYEDALLTASKQTYNDNPNYSTLLERLYQRADCDPKKSPWAKCISGMQEAVNQIWLKRISQKVANDIYKNKCDYDTAANALAHPDLTKQLLRSQCNVHSRLFALEEIDKNGNLYEHYDQLGAHNLFWDSLKSYNYPSAFVTANIISKHPPYSNGYMAYLNQSMSH